MRRCLAALGLAVFCLVWSIYAPPVRADASPTTKATTSVDAATAGAVAQFAVLVPTPPARGTPPSTTFAVLLLSVAIVAALCLDAAMRRRGPRLGVIARRSVRTRGPPFLLRPLAIAP